MRQKLTLLTKTMLLLCALIVGSGSAWAVETKVEFIFTQNSNNYGWSGTPANSSDLAVNDVFTNGNVTFTYTAKGSGSTHLRWWSTTDGLRSYKGNKFKIATSVGTIESITFDGTCILTESTSTGGSISNNHDWTKPENGSITEVEFECSQSSGNKTIKTVTVTISTGNATPTISATPTSLSGFTYVKDNGPSAAQTISVSGSNLTANIGLSLGENSNYEMCLTENGTYTSSLTLTPTNGTVSATNVYARLKSGLTAGDKSGSITLTSTDATDATVSLSGSVTTLTVTYNANGATSGSVPTDNNSYSANANVTVLGNTGSLEKTGYAFIGWNTQADGKGTNYSAGSVFAINVNTTLYAIWAIVGEVFYESFDENTGTGGNDGTWSGITSGSAISNDVTGWSFVEGKGASKCARFGTGSAKGSATTPSLSLAAGIYTLKFKAGAWNSNKESTTLKLSSNNDKATLVDAEDKAVSSVTLEKGSFTNYTVTVKVTEAIAVKISFEGNADSNSRFFLDEVQLVMNSATVSVGAKGFATFVSGQALDFTGKSIQAYTISSTNGSALTLTPKANVAKNEPVLLYSETNSDKQSIPVIATADVDATNKLVQGTGASITWSESAKYYVLYTGGEAPGFFRANASPIAKDKAYLDLTGVGATARFFSLVFDGEAQGIDDLNLETINDNRHYDLQGRRVAQPTKGMYIVNGKKVIMK